MPKRSNEFQDLVALIERALAPLGAKVTESAMILGADDDEEPREIDVLIESNFGPYNIKVAVEAKDEKRKMDVVRFESIVAKYKSKSGIQVNKVVVVSRSGFTKRVAKRAQLEDIELLTLHEALAEDWARAAPQHLDFCVAPHLAGIEIYPRPSNEDLPGLCSEGRLICLCCGKDHETPESFIHSLINDQDLLHDLRAAASRRDGSTCAKVERQLRPDVVLRYKGTDYPVQRLIYHIHCTHARTELSVKAFRRGEHLVHHMSGAAAGKEIQFVVPNGHESERIVFKISNAPTPPREPNGQDSQPKVPELQSSEVARELADRIRHECEGLNVKVDAPSTIHDLSSGSDVPIDLLVRIYIAGQACRTRTAVLFLAKDEVIDEPKVEKWANLARAAELDRLLLIVDGGSPLLCSAFPKPLLAVEGRTINSSDLLTYISPELIAFGAAIRSAECFLYSSKPKKPNQVNDACELVQGDRRVPIVRFLDAVMQQAMSGVFRGFVEDESPPSLFAERELRFEFNLPSNTLLAAPDGSSSTIGRVVGSITARAMVAMLSTAILEHKADGARAFRFVAKDNSFPSLITAALPCSNAFELTGSVLTQVQTLPPKSLPAALFGGLRGPSSAPDAAGSFPFKMASLRTNSGDQMTWSMNVFTPSTLAQALHGGAPGSKTGRPM